MQRALPVFLIEQRIAEKVVSLRRFRLFTNGFDHFLHREVEFLLKRVDACVRAMAVEGITLFELRGLFDRLLFASAHNAGRDDVELDEPESRVDEIRIELDGAYP